MMLRKILMIVGFLVALTPYFGFPQSIDKFILTVLGLFIVFLLAFSRKVRFHRQQQEGGAPKTLHVERTEVEDSPQMHIERTTVADTEEVRGSEGEETVVEKKTTIERRRKRKTETELSSPSSRASDS